MAAKADTKLPRTKPAEERREELMNAAEALFLAGGLSATTIDQIASRAGVAKGTFYLYFAAKEEMHAALGARFVERYGARIEATMAAISEGDWHARLDAWLDAAVSGLLDEGPLVDMLFHTQPQSPDMAGQEVVLTSLEQLLRAGTNAGAFNVEDPKFLALFLFAGLHGVVDDLLHQKAAVDQQLIRQHLRTTCLALVNDKSNEGESVNTG